LATFCTKCNKKLNIFNSYKCKDQHFCYDCISKLDKTIIENLSLFTADQVNDIILLANDKIEVPELPKILSERKYWIKETEKCKKELQKIERDYKKECNDCIYERDRDLKEIDRDFQKYKKDNGGRLSSVQIYNQESLKQEIQDNCDENLKDLDKNYEIDKKAMAEFINEASGHVDSCNSALTEFLATLGNRTIEIKERLEIERIQAEVEQKAQEEAERKAREEAEQRAREEEQRKARVNIESQAKEEADLKVQAELEQFKAEAEKKALAEAREKAEKQAKDEADKKLKAETHKEKKEDSQKCKENPKQLAVYSLICSCLSWVCLFSTILAFLSIPFAIAGVVIGIKGIKLNKNAMATAGIIIGGVLLLVFIVVMIAIIV
jgi:hypothetical protein